MANKISNKNRILKDDNMNQYCDYTCPNPEVKIYSDCIKETLIFPHTIGDITYYIKEELIKWVEYQQKFNKYHNYGVGTSAVLKI